MAKRKPPANSVPCAACGAPADPKKTFLYTRGRKAEEYVPLCNGCWSSGENNEAWDERIQMCIKARRGGRKPPPPKLWRVMATVKQTMSVMVEASSSEEAAAYVEDIGAEWLLETGLPLDESTDIDSVEPAGALKPAKGTKR